MEKYRYNGNFLFLFIYRHRQWKQNQLISLNSLFIALCRGNQYELLYFVRFVWLTTVESTVWRYFSHIETYNLVQILYLRYLDHLNFFKFQIKFLYFILIGKILFHFLSIFNISKSQFARTLLFFLFLKSRIPLE